jgi:hypothetical protein
MIDCAIKTSAIDPRNLIFTTTTKDMSNQPEDSVQSTSKFSLSRLLSRTISSGPDSTEGPPSTENWRVPHAYTGSFTVTVGSPEPVFEEGWGVDDFVIALVANLVTEDQH